MRTPRPIEPQDERGHPVPVLDDAPEVDPPPGLAPVQVGLLMRGRTSDADITAAIVHLLVEGHLRVVPGPSGADEPTWDLVRGTSGADLSPGHRGIVEALMARRLVSPLAGAHRPLSGVVRPLCVEVERESTATGHAAPRSRRLMWLILPLVAIVVGNKLIGLLPWFGWGVTLALYLAVLVLGVLFRRWLFTRVLLGLPPEGVIARRELTLFTAHLADGGGGRLYSPDSVEVFNRFLPWAVATGTAPQWIAAFEEAGAALAGHTRAETEPAERAPRLTWLDTGGVLRDRQDYARAGTEVRSVLAAVGREVALVDRRS